jgi:hypothetical protein
MFSYKKWDTMWRAPGHRLTREEWRMFAMSVEWVHGMHILRRTVALFPMFGSHPIM